MPSIEQQSRVVEAYRDAELYLLRLIAEAVEGSGTQRHYRNQQAELNRLLKLAQARLDQLTGHLDQAVLEEMEAEYAAAVREAIAQTPTPVPSLVPTAAVEATALDTATIIASQHHTILRTVHDRYRHAAQTAITRALVSGESNTQTVQTMLNRMADTGITGFVDRAGRRWDMGTYADMAVRTGRMRALNQGHMDGWQAGGVELVRVSQHPASHPWCYPFQGKLLAIQGSAGPHTLTDRVTGEQVTVTAVATFDEAVARGYHHPNAILGGDQRIDTLGKAVGASVGTYRGPAVTISTAQGHMVTVSPNHPVLTNRGWVVAQAVREGDYVFSAVSGEGTTVWPGSAPDLDNVIPTVEQEFSAVELVGTSVFSPTTGLNFNDDRQFLEGEVHVVVTDDCLLPVPDPHVVQETGEVRFVRPDVTPALGAGDGALTFDHLTIGGAVGRPLSNWFTDGDKATAKRRIGDSENVGEVLAGVPGPVKAEKVVNINVAAFHGKAYDFQTSEGMYAVGTLILHNCRHSEGAYIPGFSSNQPEVVDEAENERQYKALQRQRQIERNIRQWRKREAVALTPEQQAYAKRKVRAWQAAQRDHIKAHSYLTRRYEREKLRT